MRRRSARGSRRARSPRRRSATGCRCSAGSSSRSRARRATARAQLNALHVATAHANDEDASPRRQVTLLPLARETCSRACWPVRAEPARRRPSCASSRIRHGVCTRQPHGTSTRSRKRLVTLPAPRRHLCAGSAIARARPTRHGRATWTTDRHCAAVITKKKMDQGKQEQALWQQATDNVDKA